VRKKKVRKNPADLLKALDRGDIRPYYQAIVNSEKIPFSCEALLRWKGFETEGAGHIFEVAAEANQLLSLYLLIAKIVSEDINRYNISSVCVNVSPIQLANKTHIKQLTTFLNPDKVIIEITESDPISPNGLNEICFLKDLGYRIAIDDFPCNHAGLDRLFSISPSIIKLDRLFLVDADNSEKASFIKYFAKFCQEQGTVLVAEGVESLLQFNLLSSLGLEYFQGYAFHCPVHPEDLCIE
jgi:EAL domain-containing protein (putative c-di-GMP-specific phosphodiesterase class I)